MAHVCDIFLIHKKKHLKESALLEQMFRTGE